MFFWEDLGAALGGVVVTRAVLFLLLLTSVACVQRMHLQLDTPHQEPRSGERLLVFLVIEYYVAAVSVQEACDALSGLHASFGRQLAS